MPARRARDRRGRGSRCRRARWRRHGARPRRSTRPAARSSAKPSLARRPFGHDATGTSPKWNTVPPTSGPHYQVPAVWGVYTEPADQAQLVHNLEHGAIFIQYGAEVPQATVAQLKRFDTNTRGTIVAPFPALGERIALGAWATKDASRAHERHRPPREVHGVRRERLLVLLRRVPVPGPGAVPRRTRFCPAARSGEVPGRGVETVPRRPVLNRPSSDLVRVPAPARRRGGQTIDPQSARNRWAARDAAPAGRPPRRCEPRPTVRRYAE